jgi:putative FmdB family regulatory protein
MPIYEYKCENGHVFEVIQKITDESLSKCEECGAPAARVLYSPAVHFKGSGFYNTDYGKKKKGGGNGASSESSSETQSGDSSGSDSSSSDSGSSKSESKSAASAGD